MSREIKLRAWDAETKEMSYDFLSKNWLKVCIESPYVEVMQYTGLKDRNGKDIYEGDIVEHQAIGGFDKGPWIGRVTINPTQGVKVGAWPIAFSFEVIGNIYENPELLEARSATESTE